jgi:hypothetical protein
LLALVASLRDRCAWIAAPAYATTVIRNQPLTDQDGAMVADSRQADDKMSFDRRVLTNAL